VLSFAARVLSDPEAFISYVGADNKIADPVMEDPSGLNRSRVSFVPGKALSGERERERKRGLAVFSWKETTKVCSCHHVRLLSEAH